MSAQVICCLALTILSVDHLTIHMPARPISTMTEPKAMFVMTSGERTIMSSRSVRDRYPSKRLQIVQGYRLTKAGLKSQPCAVGRFIAKKGLLDVGFITAMARKTYGTVCIGRN
jgi:hypothetical protein